MSSLNVGIVSDVKKDKNNDWFKILKAAFDSSYDGLCLCDAIGNVLYSNTAVKNIYHINPMSWEKQNVKDWISDGIIDHSVTLEVIEKKEPITIIQHSGDGKEMLVTGTPIFDDVGKLIYIICNVREITELSQIKHELEKSKALQERCSEELSKVYLYKQNKMKFVANSQYMKRILEMALRVSNFDSTLLITGESGVGKSIIAKLIHENSFRKDKPFILVNCGSIPESLVESELFGYSEGAFTGAKKGGKPGYFELANEGTLFLDEIGELPLNVQVKLLHAIENQSITRVGGVKTINVDVRILAATKRDLIRMVQNNMFREDLFFRLNVVPINIPPIRERPEDVFPLIKYQLDKLCKKYDKEIYISEPALKVLCEYSYPGNVRELNNLVERSVILCNDSQIRTKDIPREIQNHKTISQAFLNSNADSQIEQTSTESHSLKALLESCEANIIKKTLERAGTQEKAAQILKVSQATIARKAHKYSIS